MPERRNSCCAQEILPAFAGITSPCRNSNPCKERIEQTNSFQCSCNRAKTSCKFHNSLKHLTNRVSFYPLSRHSKMHKESKWKTSNPSKCASHPKKWIKCSDERSLIISLIFTDGALKHISDLNGFNLILMQPEDINNHINISAVAPNRWWRTPTENRRNANRSHNSRHFV